MHLNLKIPGDFEKSWLWSWTLGQGPWDSNLFEIFSRSTQGMNLKILHHLNLELSYSQTWVSTVTIPHEPFKIEG